MDKSTTKTNTAEGSQSDITQYKECFHTVGPDEGSISSSVPSLGLVSELFKDESASLISKTSSLHEPARRSISQISDSVDTLSDSSHVYKEMEMKYETNYSKHQIKTQNDESDEQVLEHSTLSESLTSVSMEYSRSRSHSANSSSYHIIRKFKSSNTSEISLENGLSPKKDNSINQDLKEASSKNVVLYLQYFDQHPTNDKTSSETSCFNSHKSTLTTEKDNKSINNSSKSLNKSHSGKSSLQGTIDRPSPEKMTIFETSSIKSKSTSSKRSNKFQKKSATKRSSEESKITDSNIHTDCPQDKRLSPSQNMSTISQFSLGPSEENVNEGSKRLNCNITVTLSSIVPESQDECEITNNIINESIYDGNNLQALEFARPACIELQEKIAEYESIDEDISNKYFSDKQNAGDYLSQLPRFLSSDTSLGHYLDFRQMDCRASNFPPSSWSTISDTHDFEKNSLEKSKKFVKTKAISKQHGKHRNTSSKENHAKSPFSIQKRQSRENDIESFDVSISNTSSRSKELEKYIKSPEEHSEDFSAGPYVSGRSSELQQRSIFNGTEYFVYPAILKTANTNFNSGSTGTFSDKIDKVKGRAIDIPVTNLDIPVSLKNKAIEKKLNVAVPRVLDSNATLKRKTKRGKIKQQMRRGSWDHNQKSLVFVRNNVYFLSKGNALYSLSNTFQPSSKENIQFSNVRKGVRCKFTTHLSHEGYNTFTRLDKVCNGVFPDRITDGVPSKSPEDDRHYEAVLSLRILTTLRRFRKYYKRLRKRRTLDPILKFVLKSLEKTFKGKSRDFKNARERRKRALNMYDCSSTKQECGVKINEKFISNVKNIYKIMKKTNFVKTKEKYKYERAEIPINEIEIARNVCINYMRNVVKTINKKNMKINGRTVQEIEIFFNKLKEIISELAKSAAIKNVRSKKKNWNINMKDIVIESDDQKEKDTRESVGDTQNDGKRQNNSIKNGSFSEGRLEKDGILKQNDILNKENGHVTNTMGYMDDNENLSHLANMIRDALETIREIRKKKKIMKRIGRDVRRAHMPYVSSLGKDKKRSEDKSYAKSVLTYSYMDMDLNPQKIKIRRELAKRRVNTIEHYEWSYREQDKSHRPGKWECIINEKVNSIRIGHIYSAMNRFEYPYRGHYLFNADGQVSPAQDVLKDTVCCIVIITKYSLWSDPDIQKFDKLFYSHVDKIGGKCGVITLSLDKDEVEWVLSMMYRPANTHWWYINFKSSLKWYFLMKYKPTKLPTIFAIDQYGCRTSQEVVPDLETFGPSAVHKWARSSNMVLPVSTLGNFDFMDSKEVRNYEVSIENIPTSMRNVVDDWEYVLQYHNKFTPQIIRYSDIR